MTESRTRKQIILDTASDAGRSFAYSDRREDEDLSTDDLHVALARGEVTIGEIQAAFLGGVKRELPVSVLAELHAAGDAEDAAAADAAFAESGPAVLLPRADDGRQEVEYKVEPVFNPQITDAVLNSFADEGWYLVTAGWPDPSAQFRDPAGGTLARGPWLFLERPKHVHNSFRCPPHVDGCGCPDSDNTVCNPYYTAGYCPDER